MAFGLALFNRCNPKQESSDMSGQKPAIFDETVQMTNIWLKELMERLNWQDRGHAYRALRATLHALRDRIPVNTAAAFASQLPMLARGFYYEGWRPADTPSSDRTRQDFLTHIAQAFENEPEVDAAEVVNAVFELLDHHISPGEIESVKKCLPQDIRRLWPR